MTSIQLQNVCVDYPIFDASTRSLKKHLVGLATGGHLDSDTHGKVIVRAIDNLSLTIQSGERVGIIGHNGAGKSTLLRLLNGVYAPTSGSILTNGKVSSLIDISLGIDPEITGKENIYLRGTLLGLSKAEINQKLKDIIEFSDLGDFINMPLRTYSTGMKLRLAFSVSTVIRPEILIMDEWLSVGDQNFKQKAERRISELVKSTNILVIATHSKDLLLKTCSRVIWLEHGCVRMDSNAEEVVQAYYG